VPDDDARPLASIDASTVEAGSSERVTVVRVDGEVDLSNAEQVRSRILAEVADEPEVVIVDLGSARYLDSAGIRLLFDLSERFATHRIDFRLVVPTSGLVHRVLELTGVMRQMAVYETVDAAVAGGLSI
jgi:anti-sigma B factor antagonist